MNEDADVCNDVSGDVAAVHKRPRMDSSLHTSVDINPLGVYHVFLH
jgi:hypothetical protein